MIVEICSVGERPDGTMAGQLPERMVAGSGRTGPRRARSPLYVRVVYVFCVIGKAWLLAREGRGGQKRGEGVGVRSEGRQGKRGGRERYRQREERYRERGERGWE